MDSMAIRICNLTKVYPLWNSPHARVINTVKKLPHFILPEKIKNKTIETASEFKALQNINLDIKKGESIGFIGTNGSGKSTLLKIISGKIKPTKGQVIIDGKVAILDYSSGFNGDFTGKENIYIKGTLLGLNRKQINARYHSIVDFADIGDFIHQPVKKYSSGMCARLGFAIMAHVDADILISDEALAVGDTAFIQKCMVFIRDFIKQGTFLFVSHSMQDILSLCQRAVWLDKGQIKQIGTSASVTSAYLNNAENLMLHDNNIEGEESQSSQKIFILNIPNPAVHKPIRLHHPTLEMVVPDFVELKNHNSMKGATILDVILTHHNIAIKQCQGNEKLRLEVKIKALKEIVSPIVAFFVLDRLGQILFFNHSYEKVIKQPFNIKIDQVFSAYFTFNLPLLANGEYVVAVSLFETFDFKAITQLNKLDEALVFHVITKGPRHGLVGVPMLNISLNCQSNG